MTIHFSNDLTSEMFQNENRGRRLKLKKKHNVPTVYVFTIGTSQTLHWHCFSP